MRVCFLCFHSWVDQITRTLTHLFSFFLFFPFPPPGGVHRIPQSGACTAASSSPGHRIFLELGKYRPALHRRTERHNADQSVPPHFPMSQRFSFICSCCCFFFPLPPLSFSSDAFVHSLTACCLEYLYFLLIVSCDPSCPTRQRILPNIWPDGSGQVVPISLPRGRWEDHDLGDFPDDEQDRQRLLQRLLVVGGWMNCCFVVRSQRQTNSFLPWLSIRYHYHDPFILCSSLHLGTER